MEKHLENVKTAIIRTVEQNNGMFNYNEIEAIQNSLKNLTAYVERKLKDDKESEKKDTNTR